MIKELHEVLNRGEIYWHQRSRVNWIQYVGKNTKIFHQITMQRRSRSSLIIRLKDMHDRWIENEIEVMEMLRQHSQDVFRTEGVSDMDGVLRCIKKLLT